MQEGALRYADDGADLERRAVRENIATVNHAPFVTPWRGGQVILVVVDFITAIPIFVSDGLAPLPFLVFDVGVVVVMVLGKGDAAHEACRKDRECQNSVQLFHWELLLNLDAHETSRVVRVPVRLPPIRKLLVEQHLRRTAIKVVISG